MKVDDFVKILGANFYTGVPDSLLRPLCDYLVEHYGTSNQHRIGVNEGNCTAMAAGYYLATGETPVVYLQNSGIGHILNPVASLLNDKVYAIPCIFIVGWRGEAGIHDEPQHIFQGEITQNLLMDMGIQTVILSRDTTSAEVQQVMDSFRIRLEKGGQVAFLVEKGALSSEKKRVYKNTNLLFREDILTHILQAAGQDPVISTTGKTSRELFELRQKAGQSHEKDFMVVGSMGHTSAMALEMALCCRQKKFWCIDGDAAVLMHMGAMAIIGTARPANLVHIVIDNEAHESVGGQPTVAGKIDLCLIAKACGYEKTIRVDDFPALDEALKTAGQSDCLIFIEVQAAIGARTNLGRPTITPVENKKMFMEYLQ